VADLGFRLLPSGLLLPCHEKEERTVDDPPPVAGQRSGALLNLQRIVESPVVTEFSDDLIQPAQYVHVRGKREWGKLLRTVRERRTELESQVEVLISSS
jgi:hypothetical protein